MSELVKEFIADFIGRVVPGLIVLSLYAGSLVGDAFDKHSNQTSVVCFCVLLVAWLIGLVLENLTFVILHILWWLWRQIHRSCLWTLQKVLHKKPARLAALLKFGLMVGPKQPIPEPNAASPDDPAHRLYRKHLAEKALFRGLMAISVLTLGLKPNPPIKIEWKFWYGLGGLFVAIVFWLYATFYGEPGFRSLKKKNGQETGSAAI